MAQKGTAEFIELYEAQTIYSDGQIDIFHRFNRFLASLSLIGAIFIVFMYLASKQLRFPEFKLIVYLALADIGICAGLLMGAQLKAEDRKTCVIQGFLINIFAYSSVFWATQIGIVLYRDTVRKVMREELFSDGAEIRRLLIGYGLPLVLALL